MFNKYVPLYLLLVIFSGISEARTFPPSLQFGVATSAYQIEGAWNSDGKTPNIWDEVSHLPRRDNINVIHNNSNADIACDSYNNWERDVEMVKSLGVSFYRFSLSWTRIFPQGFIPRNASAKEQYNQKGVDYYNKLIDKLLENGIEPVVTLYHWDLPQQFAPLGSWTNPHLINIFAQYSRRCFELFGDRVKTWITFNEPRLICQVFKGLTGNLTETFPFGSVEYLCSHNILKAHAEAWHIYNNEFRNSQKGRISITLDIIWSEPASNSTEDFEAAELRRQFEFGIYGNPILNFDYPEVVKTRVAERSELEGYPESRLPRFTHAEKLKIRGTCDFLAINHYITHFVNKIPEPPVLEFLKSDIEVDAGGYNTFTDPNWIGSGAPWVKVVPWSLRSILKWLKESYRDPEIVITECGYPDQSGTLDDDERINYFRGYLNATLEAILDDGVNVTAFTAWSLMDNFEWTDGYSLKFGLYHVDFTSPNRTRTPKKSAEYFKDVVKTRTVI